MRAGCPVGLGRHPPAPRRQGTSTRPLHPGGQRGGQPAPVGLHQVQGWPVRRRGLRKPKGNGPFPALIHFHGKPEDRERPDERCLKPATFPRKAKASTRSLGFKSVRSTRPWDFSAGISVLGPGRLSASTTSFWTVPARFPAQAAPVRWTGQLSPLSKSWRQIRPLPLTDRGSLWTLKTAQLLFPCRATRMAGTQASSY